MFDSLDISSSALQAQRVRMDTIAQNVANSNTTHNAQGKVEPYRRKFAVLAAGRAEDPSKPGVRASVKEDKSFRLAFEPWNPDSDATGHVKYPNVQMEVEVVNMMEASRAYEANVTTMEVTKSMINASLRLLA